MIAALKTCHCLSLTRSFNVQATKLLGALAVVMATFTTPTEAIATEPVGQGILAQLRSTPTPRPPGVTGQNDDRIKTYKAVGTGAALILTFFIAWVAIYPTVLQGGGVWPVTLFGTCTGLAWFAFCMIALAIWWTDLPIQPADTPLRAYGLRVAILSAAVIFGAIFMFVWRTEKTTTESR